MIGILYCFIKKKHFTVPTLPVVSLFLFFFLGDYLMNSKKSICDPSDLGVRFPKHAGS